MSQVAPPSQPTVLVVDESPASATLLAAFLREHGYRVRIEHDAESAGAAIASGGLVAAFVDLGLPRASAYELIRRHGRNNAHLKILFVALDDGFNETTEVLAKHSGFQAYCSKPASFRSVAAMLTQLALSLGGSAAGP